MEFDNLEPIRQAVASGAPTAVLVCSARQPSVARDFELSKLVVECARFMANGEDLAVSGWLEPFSPFSVLPLTFFFLHGEFVGVLQGGRIAEFAKQVLEHVPQA